MKREIKFRAWHPIGDKMFSAEELGEDQLTIMPDGRGFINVSSNSTRDSEFIPEMIPMQYTGLKDKSGKEIYEGDIIKIPSTKRHPEYIGIVEWCECDCGFEIIIGKDWMPIESTNEIIGNIYENPELLNLQS